MLLDQIVCIGCFHILLFIVNGHLYISALVAINDYALPLLYAVSTNLISGISRVLVCKVSGFAHKSLLAFISLERQSSNNMEDAKQA